MSAKKPPNFSTAMDIEPFVAKLLKDIPALPEERMRLELLAKRFGALEPEEAAQALEMIYKKGPEDIASRAIRAILVCPDSLKIILGEEKFKEAHHASINLGLIRISRLFTDLKPHKEDYAGYDTEEEAKMEFVTLGQRRSMSKSNVKDTLDRLLSDPDPVVIRNILNNPRIVEKDVLKIASKRPNSPEILRLISIHGKWSKRPSVAKAVAMNPYTAPRVSIAILELMLAQDLEEVLKNNILHPQVRLSAQEILKDRRS